MHAWTMNTELSETLMKRALDRGAISLDTANTDSAGANEEFLIRAIRNNVSRDRVVIAAKVFFNGGRLTNENQGLSSAFSPSAL